MDSLYAATYRDDADGSTKRLVITVEAKKKGQRILEEQIVQQVKAAFNESPVDLVVPIAMASVTKTTAHNGGIYVAEFEAVARENVAIFSKLCMVGQALYELVPPVKGI